MSKQCLIVIVDNNAGVLARVSSLFCQRGFNIDSLTVSATENPRVSRITVISDGDERAFRQICRQTEKLQETRMIFSVEPEFSILRELLLVKFSTEGSDREAILAAVTSAGARIVDNSVGCVICEFTGSPEETDRFITVAEQFRVAELCRTGATALERGKVSYEI